MGWPFVVWLRDCGNQITVSYGEREIGTKWPGFFAWLVPLVDCYLGNFRGWVVQVSSRTSWFRLCKNSQVRKSGILFWVPSMNSISKSKTERMACHRAKICFDAMFWTSFSKTCFADLQSTLIKNFWFKRSLWNFEMHSTIDKISFFNSIIINLNGSPYSWMKTNNLFRGSGVDTLEENATIT